MQIVDASGRALARIARGLALAAGFCVAATVPVSAQQGESCSGRVFSGSFTSTEFANGQITWTWPHAAGDRTTIQASAWTGFSSFRIIVSGGPGGGSTTICSNVSQCSAITFTAQEDGTYSFVLIGQMGSNADLDVRATCMGRTGSASSSTIDLETSETTETETGQGIDPRLLSQSVATAGGAAAASLGAAISAATARGADGISVSSDGLRFSLSDRRGSGLAGWAEVRGRLFRGSIEGSGVEVTIGADTEIGESLLGAVVSYGTYDLTFTGGTLSAEAFSYGPYAVLKLGNRWQVEGYVVFARPDYIGPGGRFAGNRTTAGLRLTVERDLRGVRVTGFLGARGFSESLPALALPGGTTTTTTTTFSTSTSFDDNTCDASFGRTTGIRSNSFCQAASGVSSRITTDPGSSAATFSGSVLRAHTITGLVGSLGATAEFRRGEALRPYLSAAVEFNRFDDGLGTVSEAISPRIGAGVRMDIAAGALVLHVEGGQLAGGVSDYAASLRYRLEF